jgi:hypothetical protein
VLRAWAAANAASDGALRDHLAGQDPTSVAAAVTAFQQGTDAAWHRRFKIIGNKMSTSESTVELSSQLPRMLQSASQKSGSVLQRQRPPSSITTTTTTSSSSSSSSSSMTSHHVAAAQGIDYRVWQEAMRLCSKTIEALALSRALPEQAVLDQYTTPAAGRPAALCVFSMPCDAAHVLAATAVAIRMSVVGHV